MVPTQESTMKQSFVIGAYVINGTAYVMDDYGNLVPLDFFALVTSVCNGSD
jgi:hypothetical protein